MNRLSFPILFLCLLAGCATTPPDITGAGTQLQTRQIQTREYGTLDKTMTMRSVIATLQDLGFTIDQADAELGTITATRLHEYTMRMTVTAVQRGQAKPVNFATLYGQGPFSLARQLGITRDEAKHFIATYFERFSGVRRDLDEQVAQAKEKG